MAKTRTLRIAGAASLLGVALWALGPHVTSHISTQAVVNAPLHTVHAPHDGILRKPSAGLGEAVVPGDRLLVLARLDVESTRIANLTARRQVLVERNAALEGQIEEMAAQAKQLRARQKRYQSAQIARLHAQQTGLEAQLAAARERVSAAKAALARSAHLIDSGAVPASRHEDNEVRLAKARSDLAELEARGIALDVALRSAEAGTFVVEGQNDVPYSQQRLDEIALRRTDARTEIARLAAEVTATDRQIEAERARLAQRKAIDITTDTAGVIWRASAPRGTRVAAGAPLAQMVDCTRRFLDVRLAERHFGGIRPGEVARIQLRGSSKVIQATVAEVRGAGARPSRQDFAADIPDPRGDHMQVRIDLEGHGLSRDPAHACHVGRTAEVRFERLSMPSVTAATDGVRAFIAGLSARGGRALGEVNTLTRDLIARLKPSDPETIKATPAGESDRTSESRPARDVQARR